MQLPELVSRLDERLRAGDYSDLDASANGLQVVPDEGEVAHAAFAVDAADATTSIYSSPIGPILASL